MVLHSQTMQVWCYECDDDISSMIKLFQEANDNESEGFKTMSEFMDNIHEVFG